MLEFNAGFRGLRGERLELLGDTFYIHALQDVGTKGGEEGHDRKGDVLLVLLESSPEAGFTPTYIEKLQQEFYEKTHLSWEARS